MIYNYMNKGFIVLILCMTIGEIGAQEVNKVWSNAVGIEERTLIESKGVSTVLGRGIETPPPYTNLRAAAEWEEIEALTIAWQGYPCILKQIVAASISECRVIVFTENPSSTINYLLGNSCGGSIDLDNVDVVEQELNTIWIRDYGANTVYGSWNDDRILVDWMYNRPRPEDDVVSDALGEHLGIDVYSTTAAPYDLMNTGGNYMSDGFGTAFESELVHDENNGESTWWTTYPNHTPTEIEEIFEVFMGIDTLITMPTLPYDGIHHIDMHMKLLNESTLMVSEYPEGIADGPQINANIDYILSNFTTKWGTPFNIVRIPSPPELGGGYPNTGGWYETYSNAVFVNNKILLPTYYEQYDTTAIRIWEETMPGYEIVGIDCDDGNNDIISLSGAIHCITHSVAVEDPLLISHLPLSDTDNTTDAYIVDAYFSHRSGISEATLYSTTEPTGPWTEVEMAESSNMNGEDFTAEIPAMPDATNVFYYINGESISGKTGTLPMPAPLGWWKFRVGETAIDGMVELGLDYSGTFSEVYPNPASAITCIPVMMSKAQDVRVVLRDAMGRTLEVIHKGYLPFGETKLFFNAAQIPPGAYFIHLEVNNVNVAGKKVMVL